jgi:hypothetical protein
MTFIKALGAIIEPTVVAVEGAAKRVATPLTEVAEATVKKEPLSFGGTLRATGNLLWSGLKSVKDILVRLFTEPLAVGRDLLNGLMGMGRKIVDFLRRLIPGASKSAATGEAAAVKNATGHAEAAGAKLTPEVVPGAAKGAAKDVNAATVGGYGDHIGVPGHNLKNVTTTPGIAKGAAKDVNAAAEGYVEHIGVPGHNLKIKVAPAGTVEASKIVASTPQPLTSFLGGTSKKGFPPIQSNLLQPPKPKGLDALMEELAAKPYIPTKASIVPSKLQAASKSGFAEGEAAFGKPKLRTRPGKHSGGHQAPLTNQEKKKLAKAARAQKKASPAPTPQTLAKPAPTPATVKAVEVKTVTEPGASLGASASGSQIKVNEAVTAGTTNVVTTTPQPLTSVLGGAKKGFPSIQPNLLQPANAKVADSLMEKLAARPFIPTKVSLVPAELRAASNSGLAEGQAAFGKPKLRTQPGKHSGGHQARLTTKQKKALAKAAKAQRKASSLPTPQAVAKPVAKPVTPQAVVEAPLAKASEALEAKALAEVEAQQIQAAEEQLAKSIEQEVAQGTQAIPKAIPATVEPGVAEAASKITTAPTTVPAATAAKAKGTGIGYPKVSLIPASLKAAAKFKPKVGPEKPYWQRFQ